MSDKHKNLPDRYDFALIEEKIREFWKEKNVSQWNPDLDRSQNFVIDTPPPTISGSLHMGHVLSYCHTDFIARFKRMIGKNVFYPMGFDNNGLPTERLVEKVKGIKAKDVSREEFVKFCRDLIEIEMPKFKSLFEELALSVDWSLLYSTASPQSCKLSQMSFLDLVNKGEIYQEEQAVFWDPIDGTTIAQSEVEEKEQTALMYEIVFDLFKDLEKVSIATTRPELLPACVALLYNPEDERYNKRLANKFAVTPLFGVKIPIIADSEVVPEKGTGLVMCCTFGDMLDVKWWKKHSLPLRQVLNSNGHIENIDFALISLSPDIAQNNLAKLVGLFVKEAKNKIVEMLTQDLLLTNQHKIQNIVKCAERSGCPLEIRVTRQWFIRALKHKEALLEQKSKINWYPENMLPRLESWIEGLSFDWCISRQRFFGIPLPVWYLKSDGSPIFPRLEDLPIDPAVDLPKGYTKDEVIGELDVMDTWATSCISPQINSFGISKPLTLDHERYAKLFPMDMRPQGHEIIRTWAFGTILKSYLHSGDIPWKNIMISGWCLAENKEKMSKSKGNVVLPTDALSKYGADVVRYWSASAKLGGNTAFSVEVMQDGKKLLTKIWNAARFGLLHSCDLVHYKDCELQKDVTCVVDDWILTRLDEVNKDIFQNFEKYQYHTAKSLISNFFKREFCDRYIELVKLRLNDQSCDVAWKRSAQVTLYLSIKTILKLFAPFFPYVTEELFSYFDLSGGSIHAKGQWPSLLSRGVCDFEESVEIAMSVLDIVNRLKQGSPRSLVILHLQLEKELSADLLFDLKGATCAKELFIYLSLQELPQRITSWTNGKGFLVAIEGV
jgi:valyl-tRNA synthetase